MNEYVSTEMVSGRAVQARECGMLEVHRTVQHCWLACKEQDRKCEIRLDI